MAMTKNAQIITVLAILIVFTVALIAYFSGLAMPTGQQTPLNRIESNAGMSDEAGAPPYLAQFRADCTVNGVAHTGIVSVQSQQTPDTLDTVELKTNDGQTITFNQRDAQCDYAPY